MVIVKNSHGVIIRMKLATSGYVIPFLQCEPHSKSEKCFFVRKNSNLNHCRQFSKNFIEFIFLIEFSGCQKANLGW